MIAGPSSVASPTPTRPAGLMVRTPNNPSLYGPVRDRAVPVSQPPLSFQPAFHQTHPSNGSLVFGGFHDSNASSPAPNSGSGFPLPPMLPPFHHPVAPLDGFGRPFMVSPSFDGYPSGMMNHHGPSTPHSIHGSQSSAKAEDHSLNGRWIPTNDSYSSDSAPQVQMNSQYPNPYTAAPIPSANGSASVYQNLREQDEAVAFLRSGVDDRTYHDSLLEMRFPDTAQYQDHPDYHRLHPVVRIPAHRFVLSRSRTLHNFMKAQHVAPGGLVVLDLRGEHMRSDVFGFVIRTLYGWSIGDGIPPTDLRVRNVQDDFQLALAYIVAGQYLQLGWVSSAAVRHASRLIVWDTLELAASFVLPRVVLSPRLGTEGLIQPDDFNISALLSAVMGFIVQNFPKDFVLDVKASDCGFTRLPAVCATKNLNAPAVANGSANGYHSRQSSNSQAQLSRNQRLSTNPRLSQIKFGDISPPERNGYAGPAPAEFLRSHRTPSANDTTLSRILLNLPYELLKRILEDPNLAYGSVGGEFAPAARLAAITDIISEREARRLRTLEKSQPQLQVFQETLEKAGAPLVVDQIGDFLVNNMGFKEEVCPGDIPFLVHTWTPPNSGSVSV